MTIGWVVFFRILFKGHLHFFCYESLVVHGLLPEKTPLPLFWRPIPAPSPSSWIILGGTGYLRRLVASLHVGQQLQEGPHVVHRVVVGLQQPWGRWTDSPGPEEYMLICTSSIAEVLPVECAHGLQCKFVIIFLKITLQLMDWLIDYLQHI